MNGKAELAETKKADPLPQAATDTGPGSPQPLLDLASTVVARDSTSSALGYVASGLGGAASNVVGLDPINAGQVNSMEIFSHSLSERSYRSPF